MRSNLMKVSALVFGTFIAISATASAASPWPNTGKSQLAAIPATPWPQSTGKSSKLAAIPATPWPQSTGKSSKLV